MGGRKYFVSFFAVQMDGRPFWGNAEIGRERPISGVEDVTQIQAEIAQGGPFQMVQLQYWRVFEEPGIILV